MMLIYFRLNVIAKIFSPIIPYIKRAAQLRLSEIYIEYLNRPKLGFITCEWLLPQVLHIIFEYPIIKIFLNRPKT